MQKFQCFTCFLHVKWGGAILKSRTVITTVCFPQITRCHLFVLCIANPVAKAVAFIQWIKAQGSHLILASVSQPGLNQPAATCCLLVMCIVVHWWLCVLRRKGIANMKTIDQQRQPTQHSRLRLDPVMPNLSVAITSGHRTILTPWVSILRMSPCSAWLCC